MKDAPVETDGVYTPEAIRELRAAMPEVPESELPDGMTVSELPRRIRVETMANLVRRLQENTNA